jgi:formate-dependent nitrite reductase membrane component NrfD
VLKEPVWTWEIPCYLYTGGLAGASAGLGWLAGVRGNEVLASRAWGVALFGGSVSPLLLMTDLGRPARFLNMLRMFKVTSPMSVGSWILTASGSVNALAAAHSWLGLFPRLSRPARPTAALLGLSMSTYTAALITNTAIPVWHEARKLLPFVFGSSAALSAGAAAIIVTAPEHAGPARRLALAGAVAEGGLRELMEKQLGEQGEPYKRGQAAKFKQASRALTITGTALLALRGRDSRTSSAVAGALLSVGALAARWSVFRAGFQSAQDPKYVVGPQRASIERGARRGAARTLSRRSAPSLSRT